MTFAPPRDLAAPLTWPAPQAAPTAPIRRPVPRATPSPLSETDAVRFLQRATFGPRPQDVDELLTIGVDAWFADQFAKPLGPSIYDQVRANDRFSATIWEAAIGGDDQLRQRVVYALSQIFVVSERSLSRDAVAHYVDVLARNAFGDYRTLLEEITLTYAMADYLTYRGNRKADERSGRMPDENYAREILQLFSIGLNMLDPDGTPQMSGGEPIPTYDQDDVLGLARVFTGWVDQGGDDRWRLPLVMDAGRHAPEEKSFLGTTIPAGTDGVTTLRLALDAIAAHPNVGPFIGRQLIQRLVTSNPSPGYVARVAAVFADDGTGRRGNLAAVVRAVLVDDEAWTPPTPTTGKLREPVLRFTILARALETGCTDDVWPINELDDPDDELAQSPFRSPSVFNFYRPGYVPPASPLGDAGLTAPEFQLVDETSVIGWLNYVGRFFRNPRSNLTFGQLPPLIALAGDPAALVARLNVLLCAGRLNPATAEAITSNVAAITDGNADRQNTERVIGAMVMVAATTDFLIER